MLEFIFANPTLIWSILGALFIIIEIITISFFAVFFAIGAFTTAICSIWIHNTVALIIIFAAVSVVSLILGKPILKKYFKTEGDVRPSAINALIGKTGIVKSATGKIDTGQVKVNGEIWTAFSDEKIPEGTEVIVTEVSGVKVKVEPAKPAEQ